MLFSTLALSLLATLPIQEPAAQPAADFTGLIPADATVVVQIESLEVLQKTMVAVFDVVEPGFEPFAMEELLTEVLQMPFSPEGLDPTRPMYVGLSIQPNGIQATYLMPAGNLTDSTAMADLKPVVRGD